MKRNTPSIAIIGAGFGGIAMAVKLKQAGIESFTILEANAGPGGTWWANTYPGSEVDIHSAIYSFSFHSYNWSRTHGKQPELLEYTRDVIRKFGLEPHLRYNSHVDEIRWDDAAQTYSVTTADNATEEYNVVVAATGMFDEPKIPDWPGLESFGGVAFHSAQWRSDVDLRGKVVGIVGVGASAAQIVPAIAPDVERLHVFQREPGWVLPKGDRPFDVSELKAYSNPVRRWFRRAKMMTEWELRNATKNKVYNAGSKRNHEAGARALAYIDDVFKDRPDLREGLTPQYTFSAKRRIVSSVFYEAFLRDNVELVPHTVTEVTPTGVVDASGRETPLDVLIIATGFKANQYLGSLRAYGRDGVDLHEMWRDGPFALLGMTVPSFPNMYMAYGPNTNAGMPITSMHESQARFVVAEVRRMMRHGYTSIEVKPSYVERFNRWLQKRFVGTAWLQGNNYFRGPKGQIVTQWPAGLVLYEAMWRVLRRPSSIGRTKTKGTKDASSVQ